MLQTAQEPSYYSKALRSEPDQQDMNLCHAPSFGLQSHNISKI